MKINEMKKGDVITSGTFMVAKFAEAKTKANKPYLNLILNDETGSVGAKMWDLSSVNRMKDFSDDCNAIEIISATVDEWQGNPQLNISKFDMVKVEASEYAKKYDGDVNAFVDEMIELIKNNIDEQSLPGHIFNLFINSDEAMKAFSNASAATSKHHNYIGGLAVHTYEVVRLTLEMCKIWDNKNLNVDLALVGAFFHDVGKIEEYDIDKNFERTIEGFSMGHHYIGAELIHSLIIHDDDLAEHFNNIEVKMLKHIILSHHGKKEWGSPVEPICPEAMIVHCADLSSAWITPFVENSSWDGEEIISPEGFGTKMLKKKS